MKRQVKCASYAFAVPNSASSANAGHGRKQHTLFSMASLLLLVLVLFLAAGCGAGDGRAGTSGDSAASDGSAGADAGGYAAVDNSKTKIAVMTQEYLDDESADWSSIAEILVLDYDAGQPALEASGGKNPEIDMLNNAVRSGIGQGYADFLENHAEGEIIEIKSYPFTSEDYLQIVTTCVTFPNYGTDGDLYSYNFDKKQNKFLNLQDAMGEFGLDGATLLEKVKSLYEPESETESVSAAEAAGFLLQPGEDGPLTLLLLRVTIDNTEAAEWTYFFVYAPEYDSLSKMDSEVLFEPGDLDVMDPPLSYARAK